MQDEGAQQGGWQATHLAGELRQYKGCTVHVRVIVFQLHLLDLGLCQLLHGLPEVGALGTRDQRVSRKGSQRLPMPYLAGEPQLTGFLLHSMKPIWPLG